MYKIAAVRAQHESVSFIAQKPRIVKVITSTLGRMSPVATMAQPEKSKTKAIYPYHLYIQCDEQRWDRRHRGALHELRLERDLPR